jgi:hypothetical protein
MLDMHWSVFLVLLVFVGVFFGVTVCTRRQTDSVEIGEICETVPAHTRVFAHVEITRTPCEVTSVTQSWLPHSDSRSILIQ